MFCAFWLRPFTFWVQILLGSILPVKHLSSIKYTPVNYQCQSNQLLPSPPPLHYFKLYWKQIHCILAGEWNSWAVLWARQFEDIKDEFQRKLFSLLRERVWWLLLVGNMTAMYFMFSSMLQYNIKLIQVKIFANNLGCCNLHNQWNTFISSLSPCKGFCLLITVRPRQLVDGWYLIRLLTLYHLPWTTYLACSQKLIFSPSITFQFSMNSVLNWLKLSPPFC